MVEKHFYHAINVFITYVANNIHSRHMYSFHNYYVSLLLLLKWPLSFQGILTNWPVESPNGARINNFYNKPLCFSNLTCPVTTLLARSHHITLKAGEGGRDQSLLVVGKCNGAKLNPLWHFSFHQPLTSSIR